MVQTKKALSTVDMPNGATTIGRDQSNMSFAKKAVGDNRQQNSNGFRTDSAISGNRFQGERTLQRWVPDETIPANLSLDAGNNQANGGAWDQFAANEQLFGLKTDYDENIYTTTIDKSHPEYNKRYAAADRKAREIENSVVNNRHVAEERITDNLTVDDSGLDEEDKYSGVQRQDFPSLSSTSRSNKYTPPARRAPSGKATVSGAPVDPAIISSQLARPAAEKPAPITAKPEQQSKPVKREIATPPTTTESSFASTQDSKTAPAKTATNTSRTASPHTQATGTPNATATVEVDVVTAFKGFAAQQRTQADNLRMNKARADKDLKLKELKSFAASFKLNSPLPTDLVAIIAKDPAKQRAIQENARRQAEEVQHEKMLKASASQATSPGSTVPPKSTPRSSANVNTVPTTASGGSHRQTPSRTPNAPQGASNNQAFRQERGMRSQGPNTPQQAQQPPLSSRLRSIEHTKNGSYPSGHDARHPPTGPASAADPSMSRRTSATAPLPKLNPSSMEFRPSPFAASFNPTGKSSNASSPRSNSVAAPQGVPSASGSFLRRKPGQPAKNKKQEPTLDIIERLSQETPPQGRDWTQTGGIRPAYETFPTWRQIKDDEPPTSTMHLTYAKLFENARFNLPPMSPSQSSATHPQVPHQHQLPFHLQQGPHHMSQRPSPRQPPLHMHNNQGAPHNPQFHANDDHRMIPSHSGQSFASPRLQQVNVAYASPMGQPAQLAFQQPGMQYPMPPGTPQMAAFRSYSGGHQFMPQQPTPMGGPVMIQGPGGAYIGTPNLMAPGPPMLYPVGQPHFVPQQGGPPALMAGSNGYSSPGRGAQMMIPSGSQQGQQVYGMSPGMQYGQPVYAQQAPGQMQPQMRVYPPQGQHYGTSPQMHQYNQTHRGGPNGNYNNNNKSYHHQANGPHPAAPPHQAPAGPQRTSPDAEEAK